MTKEDIERIKKDGANTALMKELETLIWRVKHGLTSWVSEGKTYNLAVQITEIRKILDSAEFVLNELKKIDPRNT